MTPRPNLEWLRGAARTLLNAWRAGDPAATSRIGTALPGAFAPSLARAQSVISREQGFPSWPALKAAVEARSSRRATKPPSSRQLQADAAIERLLAAARTGDPKVLADLPGVGRGVILVVRDRLQARRADRASVLGVCLKGLTHPNPRVRFECAHAIDVFGDASCREPLIGLIDDPVPRVRRMAMHALSCDACKEDLWGEDDEVRGRIAARALGDRSVQVRRHAVWAVAMAGGVAAAETLAAVLARDTDVVVQRNAAAALRRLLRGEAPD